MATLSVWKFPTADGADAAVDTLRDLEKQELLTLHDAATVSWPQDAKRPTTRQLNDVVGSGALGGAFWGLLLGLIFFMPLLGAAIGAVGGAVGGELADAGIDDEFINQARDKVVPGTSALFVLSSDVVLDKVHDAFTGRHPELINTNLTGEQEHALRSVFA